MAESGPVLGSVATGGRKNHFRGARVIFFNYYYYMLGMETAFPSLLLPSRLAPVSLFEVITVVDRLMMSPEPFVQKCKSLARAKNPYLDVANGRVRQAWTVSSSDDFVDFMERADAIGLGLIYDMLFDALFEAGGAIDINGSYPVDDAIRQRLRRIFNKWYCGAIKIFLGPKLL